jgi:hypothetical protein
MRDGGRRRCGKEVITTTKANGERVKNGHMASMIGLGLDNHREGRVYNVWVNIGKKCLLITLILNMWLF